MNSHLFRQLSQFILTLFVAVSLNFLLPQLMPGDPIALIAGSAVRQMNAEQIGQLRAEYGLDEPIGQQYLRYLGRLARGDLGQSYRYSGGQSVAAVVRDRLGWTFFLVATSLAIAIIAGTALGMWAAWNRGGAGDLGLLAVLFGLRSMPPFWIAMILIPIFSVTTRLLPSGDSYSFPRPTGLAGALDVARHAVLPVAVLALSYIPVAFAITRSAMLNVVGATYLDAVRAKGLSERAILLRHAAPNALLPIVTQFALDFGQLLGGVVLIETVFNYRGIGSMMFEAVKTRDYPLLRGGFLAFTLGVLIINILTELLYPRLDPRLREGMA